MDWNKSLEVTAIDTSIIVAPCVNVQCCGIVKIRIFHSFSVKPPQTVPHAAACRRKKSRGVCSRPSSAFSTTFWRADKERSMKNPARGHGPSAAVLRVQPCASPRPTSRYSSRSLQVSHAPVFFRAPSAQDQNGTDFDSAGSVRLHPCLRRGVAGRGNTFIYPNVSERRV